MDVAHLSQLRPRGVWDLLDDAFDLYRERFATLAGLSAVVFVPAHLLNTWITTVAFKRLTESRGSDDPTNVLIPLAIYGGAILVGQPILLLAQAIQTATTARAVERRLTGERLTGALVWRDLRSRIVPIAWVGLLAALATVLATGMTCGVGWFFLTPLWCFVPAALALEKSAPMASFKRSQQLAYAGFGRVLGLLALLYVIEVGLQAGLTGLFELVVTLLPDSVQKANSTATFVGSQGASAIAALFLSPLNAVAVTLIYFDTRVRKEGLDIVALASETDVALAELPR